MTAQWQHMQRQFHLPFLPYIQPLRMQVLYYCSISNLKITYLALCVAMANTMCCSDVIWSSKIWTKLNAVVEVAAGLNELDNM
jgi:hypothetical protein